MKKFYSLCVCLFVYAASFSQTITLGGQCMTGTITITQAGTENGKPYYEGTGTVTGLPGIGVGIMWIGAPENVWVIAFDGQPYFQNTCNTPIPPGTSPQICPWTPISGAPTCTGAAPLVVAGNVVLPVTLTNFTATAGNNNVLLQWKTEQEVNNRGFHIEHSTDGQHWSDIGFVSGVGNSSSVTSYGFTHQLPANGINYYRLRQEDIDGRTSYSGIVTASFNSHKFFSVSDNPGNGIYTIKMYAGAAITELYVTDATGRTILRKTTTTGNQQLDISRQAQGVYWLRVKKGTEQATVKLIKL